MLHNIAERLQNVKKRYGTVAERYRTLVDHCHALWCVVLHCSALQKRCTNLVNHCGP